MTPAAEKKQRSRRGTQVCHSASKWNFARGNAASGKDFGSAQNLAGEAGKRQFPQPAQRDPLASSICRCEMPDLHGVVSDGDGVAEGEQRRERFCFRRMIAGDARLWRTDTAR